MEKDTVLLSIEKYNELRDFKNKIIEGKCYKIPNNNYINYNQNVYYNYYFIDEKEVISNFEDEINKLQEENKTLKKQIDSEKNSKLSEDFSKMSFFEFRKWKKEYNSKNFLKNIK